MINPGLLGAVGGQQGGGQPKQIGVVRVIIREVLPTVDPARIRISSAAVLVGRQGAIVIIWIHRPCQRQLFDVGHALDGLGSLLGARQGGQKQGRQDGDDGDDHQQFDQGET